MLTNGNFEDATITTGWTATRVTATEELTDKIQGTKCIKLVANDARGAGTALLLQSIPTYATYAGKVVTVGAWVKALSTNVNTSYIQIWSKSGIMAQLAILKDDKWHFLTVSHTVDAAPTDLRIYFFVKSVSTANTTDTLYVDDVALAHCKNEFLRFPVRSTYI